MTAVDILAAGVLSGALSLAGARPDEKHCAKAGHDPKCLGHSGGERAADSAAQTVISDR